MLTKELIKGQSALSTLTDEQVAAIATLSQNDENEVVGRVTGQIHGYYDENFKSVLGIDKPTGVKSSEFWKEQVAAIAAKAGDNTEVDTLKKNIAELEEKIKSGQGTTAMLEKLEKEKADLAATVEDLRKKYTEVETEYKTKLSEKEKAFHASEVSRLLDAQLSGLKLNEAIPENLRRIALNTAKQDILGNYETEITKDANGTPNLIFKKDGVILSNRENGLNPFTALELVSKHDAVKDILHSAQSQAGAGTNGKSGSAKVVGDVVQVGSVKSKMEADEAIKAALHAQGIASTDPKYHEIKKNTWKQVVEPMNLPLK